jgi:UDP-glucose:(heptosyl)LPS alpha-1,3-glucosyltransferase
MKVVIITKKFTTRTGNERVATQVAHHLHRQGYQVEVYCQKKHESAEDIIPAKQVHKLMGLSFDPSLSMWSFAKKSQSLAKSLKKKAPETIVFGFNHSFVHDVYRLGGGTHRGFMLRTEQGGRSGGPLVNRVAQKFETKRFSDPRCQQFIVPSHQVGKELQKHYGISRTKITTVYNGVDLEKYHPLRREHERVDARKRWGLSPTDKVALFVGQDLEIKGFRYAVRAADRAGCRLVYVGKAKRPDDLSKNVIWDGERDDVEVCYRAANALILPSHYESFSNVTLEAFASGLPVVTTQHVGATELLADSKLNDLVVEDPQDVTGLCAGLVRAVDSEEAYAHFAREIAENHGIDNFGDRIEDVLKKVLTP